MIQIVKDKEYTEWIAELSHRYRQSQIKASVSLQKILYNQFIGNLPKT